MRPGNINKPTETPEIPSGGTYAVVVDSERGTRHLDTRLSVPTSLGSAGPNRTALDITTIVITNLIETQLSEETQKIILSAVDAPNDEEKEPFIQRCEWIVYIAESWIKEGTIDKEDLDRTLHEIAGALKGVDAHERQKDRVNSAIDRMWRDREEA